MATSQGAFLFLCSFVQVILNPIITGEEEKEEEVYQFSSCVMASTCIFSGSGCRHGNRPDREDFGKFPTIEPHTLVLWPSSALHLHYTDFRVIVT